MPDIKKVKVVPYSPKQMYALVNDIKSYPEFVPWCHKSELLSENEDELRAKLHFSGGGFEKSFTTCNRLQKDKMIELRLVDGPFQHLEGFWRFDEQPEGGCAVVFDLEFEFSNKLLSIAFGPFFHQVANSLVDAFTKRAEEIYA